MGRASAGIPGLFESVQIDGHTYSDGGVILGVDVFSAVGRCRERGVADENIVVDIVTCDTQSELKPFDSHSDDNTVDLALRALQIMNHHRQMSDITDACAAYPKINWRFLVEPSKALPSNGL